MKPIRGYKVFNPDWTCRGKQYTCPGKFEEDVTLSVCNRGMHFCRRAVDCFNYYAFDPNNRVAEVVAYGTVEEDGDKCCTDKLEIVRVIQWDEVLRLVNTGDYNTGYRNTGDYNTGDYNTGRYNTGRWNTGDWNTGDYNTGDWNTGDWNSASYCSGCFNTVDQPIYLFNRLSTWAYSDWENSEARRVLKKIQKTGTVWVVSEDMTEDEKANNPSHKTTGGYLRNVNDLVRLAWDELTDREKAVIMEIPNFDKEIFKEITGIDVDGEEKA